MGLYTLIIPWYIYNVKLCDNHNYLFIVRECGHCSMLVRLEHNGFKLRNSDGNYVILTPLTISYYPVSKSNPDGTPAQTLPGTRRWEAVTAERVLPEPGSETHPARGALAQPFHQGQQGAESPGCCPEALHPVSDLWLREANHELSMPVSQNQL